MAIKSETMRRMEAMAAAGLQPDMTVCIDTMTVRNGRAVMLRNPRWTELYDSNSHVRAAYDEGRDDIDSYFPDAPTITHHAQPASEPLVKNFKRDEAIDVTPVETFKDITPVPKTPVVPMAEETLVNAARRMAEDLRDPHANNVPDHAHLAWLLDRLADKIEEKDADHTRT